MYFYTQEEINQAKKYRKFRFILQSKLTTYLNKGWTALGYTHDAAEDGNYVRILVAKGRREQLSPSITVDDLDRLPELSIPDYQDPVQTIKQLEDPEALFNVLQTVIIKMSEIKPTDTTQDGRIRALARICAAPPSQIRNA